MDCESGRMRQQGSVRVTGPAIKVLNTLYYSCSSTALAVEASRARAVSVTERRGS